MLLHHSMTFWFEEQNLIEIKWAYKDFESLIAEKLIRINQKIKTTKADSAEKQELSAEYVMLDDMLRQNVRYAMFIASYAQFEQALFHICEDFRERFALSLSVRDIAGQGIRKYQIYLKKVVGVRFPDDEPEWQRILSLNKLRNHLVHESRGLSETDGSHSEILKIIKYEKYLSASDPSEIYFHRHFLPNVIDLFDSFIKEIAYRSVDDLAALGRSKNKRISLKSVKSKLSRGFTK